MAIHLTRRARGLPLWFSLAVHGTQAYTDAIEAALTLTRSAAALRDEDPLLEIAHRPELSVIVFRRLGWDAQDYVSWQDGLLEKGVTFVAATEHDNETLARLCFINPLTTMDDVRLILEDLRRVAWIRRTWLGPTTGMPSRRSSRLVGHGLAAVSCSSFCL